MNIDAMLEMALESLEALKGESVRVLDVAELTTITDHMVVCSGRSARHVKRLAEHLVREAKRAGIKPGVEGMEQADWVLVDLGGVLVHIMQPMSREYFQLEKLWDLSAMPSHPQSHESH